MPAVRAVRAAAGELEAAGSKDIQAWKHVQAAAARTWEMSRITRLPQCIRMPFDFHKLNALNLGLLRPQIFLTG